MNPADDPDRHIPGTSLSPETEPNFPVYNHRSTVHAEDTAISALLMGGGRSVVALACVCIDQGVDETPRLEFPCGSCRDLISMYSAQENGEDVAQVLFYDGPRSIADILPNGVRVPIDELEEFKG